jgi:hypothetical protein
MPKTIIHVNRQKIAQNKKNGTRQAVLTAKDYKSNKYGHQIDLLDQDGRVAASLVYTPDSPQKCGAVAYIVTYNDITVKQDVEPRYKISNSSKRHSKIGQNAIRYEPLKRVQKLCKNI